MATKIYSYGARAPVESGDRVAIIAEQARGYHNAQIASARRLRDIEAAVVRAACARSIVEAADRASRWTKAWIALSRKLRGVGGDRRQRGRSDVAGHIERARLRERDAHRLLWAAEKQARRCEEVKTTLAELRAAHLAAQRALRADLVFGGPGTWGTRGLVDGAVKSALEAVEKRRYGKDGKPADPTARPQFRRGGESARIGVQIVGGLPVTDALACADSQMRVELLDDAPRISKGGVPLLMRQPGSRRAGARRALVWLRIDSDGRAPVWAKVPIILHRPLPLDGVIKVAWLLRREVGPRVEWAMQFTVASEDKHEAMADDPSTVAVNLGWRRLADGGLRVGFAVGSDGTEQEIRLAERVEGAIEHSDSIAAIRGRALNIEVDRVKAFVASDGLGAPAGLCRFVTAARHWWPERLHELLARWNGTPTGPEGLLVEALRVWAKQDRHLHFWEADESAKAARRRRDDPAGFRAIAKQLADRFDRIAVTDMDIAEMGRQEAPEDGSRGEGRNTRRQARAASPGVLKVALREAFERKGPGRFLEVRARFATRTCPSCGVVAEDARPFAAGVVVVCEACGAERDQDVAHGRRLLAKVASGEVVFKAGEALAPPENGGVDGEKKAAGGRWRKGRSQRGTQVPAAEGAAG